MKQKLVIQLKKIFIYTRNNMHSRLFITWRLTYNLIQKTSHSFKINLLHQLEDKNCWITCIHTWLYLYILDRMTSAFISFSHNIYVEKPQVQITTRLLNNITKRQIQKHVFCVSGPQALVTFIEQAVGYTEFIFILPVFLHTCSNFNCEHVYGISYWLSTCSRSRKIHAASNIDLSWDRTLHAQWQGSGKLNV